MAASSAADISAARRVHPRLLPKATVTTSSDLASEVTGSLSSASSLANNLGKWLAIAVLIAAFLLASLLTMAAVSRRVREFGTLKALGWNSRRIIGQVMGESLTIGIIGGVAGVALGFAGAAIVTHVAPAADPPRSGRRPAPPPRAGHGHSAVGVSGHRRQQFRRRRLRRAGPGGLGGAAHTVAVHLTASVTAGAVVLAVVLAIAGGLIAGSFGGWRAARLRPGGGAGPG